MTSRRNRLPLVLAIGVALGMPALAGAQQVDPATQSTTTPSQGKQAPSDPRHATTDPHGHVVDLDAVTVTATPFQDTAAGLSKPTDVLAGARLDEARAASLGETISGIAGVQSSNFGPGVGRPIIRGMDGPRVAVLSGGLSTEDVSTVSQDHSPTIEPFLADQIEVLKGPSTLLYGSGAIGGVVNVVDGRIPEEAPSSPFGGRAEMRIYGGDQGGETDMARIDGGNDRFALHADAVYRNALDYDTPQGRQPNSFIDTRTGAIGGSLLGDWGFLGVSASRFEDNYGNPGEPGDLAIGERGVHIEMRQNRYDLKGGLTEPWGEGSGLRFSVGHTSYQHIEFEGDEAGTTFTKNANEGRVEATFGGGDAAWSGAIGAQGSKGTFEAIGEESFVPRTTTRAVGVFGLARRSWNAFQLDLGARLDDVKSDPVSLASRGFKPVSASIAGGWKLNDAWRLTANLDHAERAPVEEELFADGPHIATLAYEVGDANLGKEASNQIELGVQYTGPRLTAKASAYYNRFKDFIYLADTGDNWYWDEEDDYLPIRQWSQSDATFRGLEGEATLMLADGTGGRWELRGFGDIVRATLSNGGGNVPRIAPSRLGMQLRWQTQHWRTSLGATRYERQNRVAANETATPGYTLVDGHAAYHFDAGNLGWEWFLDATNLTDQEAHVHTSFLKDVVALPGRSFSTGLRIYF